MVRAWPLVQMLRWISPHPRPLHVILGEQAELDEFCRDLLWAVEERSQQLRDEMNKNVEIDVKAKTYESDLAQRSFWLALETMRIPMSLMRYGLLALEGTTL